MMRTISMAWRNLWRNGRRTALTASTLALGTCAMVFMLGLLDGLFDRVVRVSTTMLSGHAQIHAEGWRLSRQETQTLDDPDALIERAMETEYVQAAAPRVWGTGLVAIGDRSRGVSVLGVDPKIEPRVSRFAERIVAGVGQLTEPRDLIVGAPLARRLELEVGSRVVLMVAHIETGEAQSEAFRVVGIVHTGLPSLDESTAVIPLATARALFGLGEAVHEIALRMEGEIGDARWIRSKLAQLTAPGIELSAWHDVNRAAAGGLELQANMRWIFVLIVFLVVSFGIANTVAMSLLERWREFGVLRALGTSPLRLGALILAEAALLGLLGASPGAGLGLAVNGALQRGGIPLGESSAYGVRFIDPVVPAWDPAQAVQLAAVLALLTALVAIISAVRVARIDPVSAMRRSAQA